MNTTHKIVISSSKLKTPQQVWKQLVGRVGETKLVKRLLLLRHIVKELRMYWRRHVLHIVHWITHHHHHLWIHHHPWVLMKPIMLLIRVTIVLLRDKTNTETSIQRS